MALGFAQPAAAFSAAVLYGDRGSDGSGVALDYAGLNAVKMLFWSAVLNGVLAPPLVILVVLLKRDRKAMGDRVESDLGRVSWVGFAPASWPRRQLGC